MKIKAPLQMMQRGFFMGWVWGAGFAVWTAQAKTARRMRFSPASKSTTIVARRNCA